MNCFKLVLLDYAKLHLDNPEVQKALSDMIIIKQKNFERTDPNYIVTDKHDMISTHFMIYDTNNPFCPKLVLALRVTYQDRAEKHKLKTPIQELLPNLDEKIQQHFNDFKINYPVLADCNAWFVDPDYSLKSSGLRLSDIAYTMVYLHLSRMGLTHFVGCTNEKYKASRWVENIGHFPAGFYFKHPLVNDPHMLILMRSFKHNYLLSVYEKSKSLFEDIFELVPEELKYKPLAETGLDIFDPINNLYHLKSKISA